MAPALLEPIHIVRPSEEQHQFMHPPTFPGVEARACRRKAVDPDPLGLLPFGPDGLYWQYDHFSAYAGAFMIHFTPHGQGFLEYALLIILVGMAVLIALAIFGTGVGNLFSNIVTNF